MCVCVCVFCVCVFCVCVCVLCVCLCVFCMCVFMCILCMCVCIVYEFFDVKHTLVSENICSRLKSCIVDFSELKIMVCHRLPTLAYYRAMSNLVGQIYCTFPMGKPMILCDNAPALSKVQPTFNHYFEY